MSTTRMGAAVAVLALAGSAAGQPPNANKLDIETVSKAWAARQEKVKSFAFDWTDHVTVPRGRVSRNRPAGGSEIKGDVPPFDLVFPSPRGVLVDGEKSRYRYTAQHWWPALNQPVVEECDASFDGEKLTASSSFTPAEANPPTGTIRRAKAHGDLNTLSARPVVVALRGTHPSYRVYDPAAYEPSGRTVPVGAARCAELVRENRAQGYKSVLLVDPARDFVLVRATRHERDKLTYTLDVTYSADPVAGWVPAAWDHVYFDTTGAVYASGRCKTTRVDLNPKLDDDALACTPPPGTLMVDISGAEQVKYVVQPDGAAGKKVPRAARLSYEQLAAAGPDESGRGSRGVWLAGAVFVASVGLLGWRGAARVRRRTDPAR